MSGPEAIPLAQPEIGAREEELTLEVLRSKQLSLGPMGVRFERELAGWLGVGDAVSVSSGTTALHLGVRALGWGPGDVVVTTPFSFVASANCILYVRARAGLRRRRSRDADARPRALSSAAVQAIGRSGQRVKAVLPVHVFGQAADMDAILEPLAERHGLSVIEDACEAIGGVVYKGRPLGTLGDAGTFAFYPNKQMTTGEGGMIVFTNPDARWDALPRGACGTRAATSSTRNGSPTPGSATTIASTR